MAEPNERYERNKPAKLCIGNQKGGVGKTTIAINLAGALNQRGRDVLFVDLDPQGNATEGLGHLDAYDAQPPTLFDALTDPAQRSSITNLVIEHEEMDIVPSNIDMTAIESELTLSRRTGEQLALALDEIEHQYEYVIVDSPPHLGHLTDNALYATQNILIPALAESTSKRALELMFDHMETLELDYDITMQECGVVANRVEETNEGKEMMEWFNEAFPDVPVWEIRKRVALQRAFSTGVSIFEYNPEVDMCDVFLSIADELEHQFGFARSEVHA
jgi:chromosome partitioning protein